MTIIRLEPAASVIEALGGDQRVAEITGAHVANVRKWRYPRGSSGRSGTDGVVPLRYHRALIRAAAAAGIAGVTAENLLPREDP